MSPVPRSARTEDARELARLAGQLGYPVDPHVMAARLMNLLTDPRQWIRVADADGCLAGWITAERRLSLESGARVEITGLVVDGTKRRGGVGRTLVAAAEAWAAEQGGGIVTVRSNVAREASHPFYESQGYLRQKSQHVYVKLLSA